MRYEVVLQRPEGYYWHEVKGPRKHEWEGPFASEELAELDAECALEGD